VHRSVDDAVFDKDTFTLDFRLAVADFVARL
jgi:hypothetical protein